MARFKPAPGGVVTRTEVWLTYVREFTDVPPRVAESDEPEPKLRPVRVTVVPPSAGPLVGEIEVMTGAS